MGKKKNSGNNVVITGVTLSLQTNSGAKPKKFKWGKFFLHLLYVLLLLGGGTFWGTKLVKPIEQEPIYIQGEPVEIEVPYPVPVKVKEPCDTMDIIKDCVQNGKYAEFFPERIKDSLVYIPTSKDTLAIVNDWGTERMYEETVYNSDSLGTAVVNATVKYNRLTYLNAEIIPVVKEVPYLIEPKKISPFVGFGFTTDVSLLLQGGVFIKDDWGGSLIYQYDVVNKKNVFGVSALYKF